MVKPSYQIDKKVYNFLLLLFFHTSCHNFHTKKIMIRGDSMIPDLTPNTVYTMTEVNTLKRYDVVVFKRKNSKDKYVKKIYGIPGDLIEYNTQLNAIEINNIPLQREDGLPIRTSRRQFRIMSSSLKEGFLESEKYLVFSSNLSGSYDSRTYGAIKKEEIVGIILK